MTDFLEQVMNFLKQTPLIIGFAVMGLPTVQADEVTTLPTIRVMAESELREEQVGPVPLQEDKKVQQALQNRIYKIQRDMQNEGIVEMSATVDYQPITSQPDLSQLSPVLQDYILAVAAGFQSSDPTNGLFKMLQPLNINRDNAESFREGMIKVNIDDILKLQQQIRDGFNNPQNKFLTR